MLLCAFSWQQIKMLPRRTPLPSRIALLWGPWLAVLLPVCRGCLEGPYLYVTFHGGDNKGDINQVLRYSRDGCQLGELLESDEGLSELRGMAIRENNFFLANSYKDQSFINQYHGCVSGSLELSRTLVPMETDGLVHPYGLAVDGQYVYSTVQDTNCVLRYYVSNGEPGPLPEALQRHASDYYEGTFAQFDTSRDGVRGIDVDVERRQLFVANKDIGVVVFDFNGFERAVLDVDQPIGVHYCAYRDSVLVGSKGDNVVYEFDASTLDYLSTYHSKDLSHPSGLTCFGNEVFVVSQDQGKILRFDSPTSKARVLIDDLPDLGEHLALGYC